MSFILDALKKADRERHLGELPGIHSRSLPTAAAPHRPQLLPRSVAWLLASVLIAIAAAGAALHFWTAPNRARTPVQLTSRASGTAAPPTPALALAPALSLTPAPSPAPAAETVPAAVAREIPVPPPLPAPVRAPVRAAAPALAPAAGRPVPAGPALAIARPNPSQDKPAAQAPTRNGVADLPPALQREIPTLAIAGSIYSANPADRMLLIDKRMLHEGDEISPGLVLETVLPKAATLRYKGYSFRVAF